VMQTTLPFPKAFRLKCKACFLTWPQNERPAADVLSTLIEKLEPYGLLWAVVATEAHKDGTPHLHAICQFKNDGVDIKDANPLLDSITGKHGNYQSARSPKKVLRYVIKDNNYLTFGDVPDFTEKPKVFAQLANCLLEGGTFADCIKIDAGQSMLNKRKLEDFEGYCKRVKSVESLLVWRPIVYDGNTPELHLLTDWLNRNIKTRRSFREPQLYLSGPPLIGKTTLLMQLSRFLRIYNIPMDEDYYDDWDDGSYDLAVMDEYKGNKPVQWLNRWLDGSMMPLKKKGSQYLKRANVATLILSNFTLEECYRAAMERSAHFLVGLEALRTRLICIHLSERFNLMPDIAVLPPPATDDVAIPTASAKTPTPVNADEPIASAPAPIVTTLSSPPTIEFNAQDMGTTIVRNNAWRHILEVDD